jgi:hypothetical protein
MWGGSAVYNFEPRGIQDQTLLSQVPDYPNLEGQVPYSYPHPGIRLAQFPFRRVRLAALWWACSFESTSTRAAAAMALLSPTP